MINHHFVAVPGLNGREYALLLQPANGNIAGPGPRCLFFMTFGEPDVFPAHLVPISHSLVQDDAIESRSKELLTFAWIPLHNSNSVQDTRELVVDRVTFPVALQLARLSVVDQRDTIFILRCKRPCANQRRIDQLLSKPRDGT